MSGMRLIALALAAGCVCLAGCDTKNMRHGMWEPGGPIVSVTVPTGMFGGRTAEWTVSWYGGTAPYVISMNMGGGTTENVAAGTTAVSPFTQEFTMVNPSTADSVTYSYTVVITDSQGLSGTATATYTVGPTPNELPVIESAVYTKATKTLLVTVSDPDDAEDLIVDVTVPPGFNVDATSKYASATGPLTASFLWVPADVVNGAAGTTTVTVTDDAGDTDSADVALEIDPFPLVDDTLYAYPSPLLVSTQDTVTVVVLTGVPANPLQFVNGIGLTIESDADKVANTFNVGDVGGGAGDCDGFWSAMAPAGGFLLPPDNFIIATDIGGGRERWDFNVTPIGGSEQTTAKGALFNYQFTFSTPGLKTFGFEEVSGVNRTYYSDASATEYFWGDSTNASSPQVTVD